MLNQDYTAKLLVLEDVMITNVENISEELHIDMENLTDEESDKPALMF